VLDQHAGDRLEQSGRHGTRASSLWSENRSRRGDHQVDVAPSEQQQRSEAEVREFLE
jgi:hypothetical protein